MWYYTSQAGLGAGSPPGKFVCRYLTLMQSKIANQNRCTYSTVFEWLAWCAITYFSIFTVLTVVNVKMSRGGGGGGGGLLTIVNVKMPLGYVVTTAIV